MEKKTTDNTETPLKADPFLVETIRELLQKDLDEVNALLQKEDLMQKQVSS